MPAQPANGAALAHPPATAAQFVYLRSGLSALRVRSSPKAEADNVIAWLRNGESVTPLGAAADGWQPIKLTDARTGYIRLNDATLSDVSLQQQIAKLKAAVAQLQAHQQAMGTQLAVIASALETLK